MNGDQMNLSVYGRPASANTPMVRKSTPETAIHACNVPPVRASGNPEENPSSMTVAMRRL
jgi:hypothetical protein